MNLKDPDDLFFSSTVNTNKYHTQENTKALISFYTKLFLVALYDKKIINSYKIFLRNLRARLILPMCVRIKYFQFKSNFLLCDTRLEGKLAHTSEKLF